MAGKLRTWVAMAVVVGLALVAGGWFFLISPKLVSAADTRLSIDDAKARTVVLTAQLSTLKKQYAELDTYKADLQALTAQIPSTDAMADYRRALDAAATSAGVTIMTITTGTPSLADGAQVPAAPSETALPGETSTQDATATDSTAAAGTDAPAPATPSAAARLVGVPVSLVVVGEYSKAMAFLAAVQTGADRLFVVSSLRSTAQPESAESPGRPATAAGDVQLAVDGYVLVLPVLPDDAAAAGDGTADAGTDGGAAQEAETTLPSSERNPFAPLP